MIENLSFCIVRFSNNDDVLRRCVASIERQPVARREILVSGTGPADSELKYVGGDATVPADLDKVRNLLCSTAAAPFAVLMADYIELADNWFDAMKSGDVFDIVGSRLVTPERIRVVDWAYRVKLGSQSYPYPLDYDEWTTRAFVTGDCMVLRRSAWDTFKFSEGLAEDARGDLDFCLRAAGAGLRVGVLPQAEATCHPEDAPQGSDLTFEKSRAAILRFREKLAAGKQAFNAGDHGRASICFADALLIAPDEANALALLGWTHYFAGRYGEAATVLTQAIAVDPVNVYARRGRGWAFLQSGSYERAIQDLSEALERLNSNHRDDWLETVRGLSWSYYHSGNWREAAKFFQQALDKSESHETGLLQDLYRGLGWTHYRQGMFAEARTCFKKAIANLKDGDQDVLRDAQRGLDLANASFSGPVPSLAAPVLLGAKVAAGSYRSKRAVVKAYWSSLSGSFKRLVKSLNC
jgi:tetratricopeptide (TPR) repeat protein